MRDGSKKDNVPIHIELQRINFLMRNFTWPKEKATLVWVFTLSSRRNHLYIPGSLRDPTSWLSIVCTYN